jgi:hypothetical protein
MTKESAHHKEAIVPAQGAMAGILYNDGHFYCHPALP